MHAADVMGRPVLTVRPDDSIEQAMAARTARNITSAPVLDAAGELVGIVSEGDLLFGRLPPGTTTAVRPTASAEWPLWWRM
jgi:CBS domain-containing protein